MKDLRIVARLYNNQLRERREATGLSACAFAKRIGVQPSRYCEFESLKISPLTSGKAPFGRRPAPKRWTKDAVAVAGALGVEPETLWPESLQEIKKTISEIRVNADDIAAMLPPAESSPFLLLSAGEEARALADAMQALTDRERSVIERHYAKHETLREIADDIGLSPARVQQIEARAIRKLRADKRLTEIGAAR